LIEQLHTDLGDFSPVAHIAEQNQELVTALTADRVAVAQDLARPVAGNATVYDVTLGLAPEPASGQTASASPVGTEASWNDVFCDS